MLTFQWRSTVTDTTPSTTLASENPELAIRDLLDDPALRRAMELELAAHAPLASIAPVRPEPVFNRRRLLERDAA